MRGKPARNIVAFLQAAPLAMYATKTAKIVNPMREYMPEHAISMANVNGGLSGLLRIIRGTPYCVPRVTGSPEALRTL